MKKALWIMGTFSVLIAAGIIWNLFQKHNELPVAEQSPIETELERRLEEVASRKDKAVRKDMADSLQAVRQDLGKMSEKMDTIESVVLDIRTEMKRHSHEKGEFVTIPDRASLPKVNPANNSTSRSASAQRSTASSASRSARTAPASNSNSGDFVTRQEFSREIDSLNNRLSRFQNLFAVTTLATVVAIDTAMARINRLTGTPNPQAPDSARTNSSIGSLVRPRTEAPPAANTGGTRHAY